MKKYGLIPVDFKKIIYIYSQIYQGFGINSDTRPLN